MYLKVAVGRRPAETGRWSSRHHFDHIAGGKAFKDAGATVIAHTQAKERLTQLKDPHTVIPDETVDKRWWRENWFQPVVRIGALGNYEHVLQQPPPCLSFI